MSAGLVVVASITAVCLVALAVGRVLVLAWRGKNFEIKRQAEIILEQKEKIKELEVFKGFAESIKFYAAGSPAPKAQGEFREHLDHIGHPLTDRHLKTDARDNGVIFNHGEMVDLYLGKVADGLAIIYEGRWENEGLRGDCYLKK